MAIDIYYMNISPPCRAVLMLMKHLGIPANLKEINLLQKEQMKPEFLKINPQHVVPTIVDDGFVLWESRAILTYLANKYASGKSIYPSDPQKKALVDKLLCFDMGTLYPSIKDFIIPQVFAKSPADSEKEEKVKIALTFLDGFLTSNKYVAGDGLTLADLSIVSTLTFLDVIDYDLSGYKKVHSWKTKLQSDLKYYKEINDPAIATFKSMKNK